MIRRGKTNTKQKGKHMNNSLQIKPRSFGEVFGLSVPVLGGGLFAVLSVLNPLNRYGDDRSIYILHALFFGIVMGLLLAYWNKGETIVKDSDDPKKVLETVTARLAENKYNLESQTESLHTFKSPNFIGGRVYVQREERTLRIVGPSYVLKKLKDV